MNFYHNEILLFILQQKLCHRILKNWKFEINNIKKILLVHVKVHDFSLKCANDEKCSLYWYAMRQALLNQFKNIMRLTDVLMFWNIVKAITTSETVYNDSLKSFTQFIIRLQVCNLWVIQCIQKVKRNNVITAENSIWNITLDELL